MGKKIKVDFSGVDKEIRKGGRASHVPEGDYLAKPVKAELRKSEEAGKGRYFNWRFQIVKPKKYKGKTLYVNTSLKPDALWNLRNLINACLGKNVAGKAVNFDPETCYGKVCGVTVEDDEYKKKIRSQIVDFFPKDDFSEDSDEDEEAEDSDDEEEEEEEDEDEDEEDEDLEDVDVEDL